MATAKPTACISGTFSFCRLAVPQQQANERVITSNINAHILYKEKSLQQPSIPFYNIQKSTMKFAVIALSGLTAVAAFAPSAFMGKTAVTRSAVKSSSTLDMKYTVAVVGGGPSGACAAEIFAQEKGIETFLFERKLDNAKPCGGAIPLCMIGEFDMPETVVDRKVRLIVSFPRLEMLSYP
jgi:NADPH-dependent glutamate synthase beta subunit-like oxidoreductase